MDDTLKDDLAAFKAAEEAEADQRKEMLDTLRFVKLAEQWPEEVIKKRKAEGRPCLTINRLPAFAKQVTNDARQNRPAIKCHPVGDGADKETAEILNGLIRNIEYSSNAPVAYDTAIDFSVNCGIGYVTVDIDYADADTFDKDILIKRVSNPFSVYGDPMSTAADSSDWNRAFVTDKLSEKEFKKRYPKADAVNFETSDDRDDEWFEEGRIRIAESWIRERKAVNLLKLTDGSLMMEPEYLKLKEILDAQGITVEADRPSSIYVVKQRIITGAEVLETNDWPGKYIPIIPCYGEEVVVEGKRSFQSLFFNAKDSQRNYNYWRTATTELVALAPKTPFVGPTGAFDTDAEKWATANVDSHAYIQYDGPGAPQRQAFAGPPAGALQEALNASDDMKNIMGLHDASLGAQSNETSGRAILARQREGDIATFNFIDNQSRMIRHVGAVLVDLIPKVYDVPRIIRVIKEDGSNYSVPVNQKVQQIQPVGEDGQPPMQGQPPQYQPVDEDAQEDVQGLIKMFDLSAGKYDVTCESGPSFTTRREEAAEQMMQFVQSFPGAAPLIGDLIAKNLDWPGADDIAKRLQGMLPPGAAGKNPQLMQAEEAINQLKQQLGQVSQELNDKRQEQQIKFFEAETKRLAITKPEGPGAPPEDHSFEQWKIQFEAENKMRLEEKSQEGAERLELIKQREPAIIAQEMQQQLGEVLGPVIEKITGVEQGLQGIGQTVGDLQAHVTAPVKIVRDASGKAIGVDRGGKVKPINRGQDGRMEGL